MTNIFPDLLGYGSLVPFFLRVFMGLLLLRWAGSTLRQMKEQAEGKAGSVALSVFFIIAGISLLLGFMTQLFALFVALWFMVLLAARMEMVKIRLEVLDSYTLVFLVSLALILLGSGVWSVNLKF
jgi:hypothetical protein